VQSFAVSTGTKSPGWFPPLLTCIPVISVKQLSTLKSTILSAWPKHLHPGAAKVGSAKESKLIKKEKINIIAMPGDNLYSGSYEGVWDS
jgi:hypothetical protein